jgi:hypothetical protein
MIPGYPTVRFTGIRPELIMGLLVLEDIFETVYKEHGLTPVDFILTSVNDSQHMVGSLHYKGAAADVRNRDLTKPLQQLIVDRFKMWADNDFDIVIESDHIHLEYDPKGMPATVKPPGVKNFKVGGK